MRYNNSRTSFHQLGQRILDQRLCLCIYAGGRVIQDQDPRVLEDRAGNGHTLLLPTGKGHPSLPHVRVVSLRHFQDELVRRSSLGRSILCHGDLEVVGLLLVRQTRCLVDQEPRSLFLDDLVYSMAMDRVKAEFVAAAEMAERAGFDMLELHCAHGYLLSSFITPVTNTRDDEFGGSLENRMRYPLEVFQVMRAVWPDEKPISVSGTKVREQLRGGETPDPRIMRPETAEILIDAYRS